MRRLALLLAVTSPAIASCQKFVEIPDPSADYISYQAVVRLPQLNPRGVALSQVLADAILDGTRGYHRRELFQHGSAASRIRCSTMPDHIRIGLSVRKGQEELGADLMFELLDSARFDDKAVKEATDRAQVRQRGYWGEALQPIFGDFNGIARPAVREFYRQTFRPENLTVAVGGAVKAGAGTGFLETKFAGWTPVAEPARRAANGNSRFLKGHAAPVSTADIRSASFAPTADFATRLLAAIALGSGKGSSAFRVLRDANAWSYRQESVLWPTPDGFQVRVIAAFQPTANDEEVAGKMRAALLEDVPKWTEADIERARGMAKAIFSRGVEYSPLYLHPSGPIGTGLDDRTFLTAYWLMKTGQSFSVDSLLGQMSDVTLEDLKSMATALLQDSVPVVLSGSKS